MKGRFVPALQAADSDLPTPNARFLVQGFRDREKCVLTHTSYTVRAASIRLLVALAFMFRMRLWGFHVTQVYLQSDTELVRDFYIEPPAALGLDNRKLLRVVKALYGLTDTCDYWHHTLRSVFVDKLGMQPSPGDPALYSKDVYGWLACLASKQSDDILGARG